MSLLYYTEEGRVIPSLGEDLTRFRHIRKTLDLPATDGTARVWILARCYPDNTAPLRLAVNGTEVVMSVGGERPGAYCWHHVDVDASALRAGANTFQLWTDTSAMDGWSIALEAGHANPGSEVSDDGGQSWRRERMGYLNAVLGEHVLRVRLEEGQDPPPPAGAAESPRTPCSSFHPNH